MISSKITFFNGFDYPLSWFKIYYMKKALLFLLILITLPLAAFPANKKMVPKTSDGENLLPNIFIYAIPDDDTTTFNEELTEYIPNETQSGNEDEITLEYEDNTIIGATTLKGYAQFIEDDSTIHLKDTDDNYILNIKTPQKITSSNRMNINNNKVQKQLQTYQEAEYRIAPKTIKSSDKIGDFTFGASYGSEVDCIAMLETETGLFTKYEKDRFALSSSFKKSLNTTYAADYNTISITPEFKLNNYMSFKNVLSADITRNRRSTKLVFALNPFGKDKDRMELEFGAKQTIYLDTDFTKTQFSFSTIFKL